jgi:hypothetical protein
VLWTPCGVAVAGETPVPLPPPRHPGHQPGRPGELNREVYLQQERIIVRVRGGHIIPSAGGRVPSSYSLFRHPFVSLVDMCVVTCGAVSGDFGPRVVGRRSLAAGRVGAGPPLHDRPLQEQAGGRERIPRELGGVSSGYLERDAVGLPEGVDRPFESMQEVRHRQQGTNPSRLNNPGVGSKG